MDMLEKRVLLSGTIFIAEAGLNGAQIGEYDTSGNTINASLVVNSSLMSVEGLAVVGSDVFIADDSGAVAEYTTSGAAANGSAIIDASLNDPIGVASDGTDAFVAAEDGNSITEFNTSGAIVNSWSTGSLYPEYIVCSGSNLFVTGLTFPSGEQVAEYSTSGTLESSALITGLTGNIAIAASSTDLFIEGPSGISEYNQFGTEITPNLIPTTDDIEDMSVSGNDLFLSDNDTDAISEYTTSGTLVDASLVSGIFNPRGIFVSTPVVSLPTAPTDVVATQGTLPHHVDLTWAAVSGATSYQVYRSTQNNFSIANKIAGGVTTNSYNDLNVAADGVIHYYWVVARNSAGVGPQSAAAVGYVPLQAPAVTVTNGPHHEGLTWAAVNNATSYQVWRATVNNVADATRIGNNITTDFFNDTTAAASTTYYYFVRAKNAATGVGLWSVVETGELT
jgi:hypothetical protein